MVYMEPNSLEEVLMFMEKNEEKVSRCKKMLEEMWRVRRRRIEQSQCSDGDVEKCKGADVKAIPENCIYLYHIRRCSDCSHDKSYHHSKGDVHTITAANAYHSRINSVRHIYGNGHFIKFLNKKIAKLKIYQMGLQPMTL